MQSAGSHKLNGRPPLLSAKNAVTSPVAESVLLFLFFIFIHLTTLYSTRVITIKLQYIQAGPKNDTIFVTL